MSASFLAAIRAGFTGLLLATFIYVLWKFSLRLHGFIISERYGYLVITTFGILLWIVWFGVAQVILIAYDELYNQTTARLQYLHHCL